MSTPRTPRAVARAATALGIALVLAACGQTGASTRAGGDAGPVVLRIGTNESSNTPAGEQLAEFAREVETRAAGTMRVEPVYQAVDVPSDDFDQKVAQMVIDGRLDGGHIPARAWDVLGVKTLRALNTPFLITTEPLANEIATGDLAPELLAGLDGVGVTGLGLVPEGLRRMVYFGDRVLAAGEMKGRIVRTPTSDTVYAVVRALGGIPDDIPAGNDAFSAGIKDGTVVAAESALSLMPSLPRNGTTAANVVLFPKVNSLVLNTRRFQELDEAQQNVLRDAGAATAAWWRDQRGSDESAVAAEYCAAGGRVVQVDGPTVAGLQAAAAPVVADLAADPATGALITHIRELAARSTPTATVAPCEPRATGTVDPAIRGVGAFPLGTYRVSHTTEELLAAGVPPQVAEGYSTSTWTLTFQADGTVLWNEPDSDTCYDRFGEAGGRLQLVFDRSCPGASGTLDFAADWTLDGDTLHLRNVEVGPDNALAPMQVVFAKGMTKIA